MYVYFSSTENIRLCVHVRDLMGVIGLTITGKRKGITVFVAELGILQEHQQLQYTKQLLNKCCIEEESQLGIVVNPTTVKVLTGHDFPFEVATNGLANEINGRKLERGVSASD